MHPIVITSKEEFDNTISQVIETAMKKALPAIVKRAVSKPYLTKTELMELTGWSSRQVEYKKSKRELPFIRRGRLVLFRSEDVYAYLNEGLVPQRKPDSHKAKD